METKENQALPEKKEKLSLQKHSGLSPRIILSIEKIQESFPAVTSGFYKNLCNRIIAHHFTDDEFERSVNHVIDTCKYSVPSIAEFITFIHPEGIIEKPVLELSEAEIKEQEDKRREAESKSKKKDEEFFKYLDEWIEKQNAEDIDWIEFYENEAKRKNKNIKQ